MKKRKKQIWEFAGKLLRIRRRDECFLRENYAISVVYHVLGHVLLPNIKSAHTRGKCVLARSYLECKDRRTFVTQVVFIRIQMTLRGRRHRSGSRVISHPFDRRSTVIRVSAVHTSKCTYFPVNCCHSGCFEWRNNSSLSRFQCSISLQLLTLSFSLALSLSLSRSPSLPPSLSTPGDWVGECVGLTESAMIAHLVVLLIAKLLSLKFTNPQSYATIHSTIFVRWWSEFEVEKYFLFFSFQFRRRSFSLSLIRWIRKRN